MTKKEKQEALARDVADQDQKRDDWVMEEWSAEERARVNQYTEKVANKIREVI